MKNLFLASAVLVAFSGAAIAQSAQPLTQDQPINNGGDASTATGSASNNSDLGMQTTNYGGSASAATGGMNEGATTTVGGSGTGAGTNNAANTVKNGVDTRTTASVNPASEVDGIDDLTQSKGPNVPVE